MQVVLGIDAAWTLTQPSGVALAIKRIDGWHLVAATASYQLFHELAVGRGQAGLHLSNSPPKAEELLASAFALCGQSVDLIAIDMPMAKSGITGRRKCDDAVSKEYWRRKCGTHSPSALQPGAISDRFRESLEQAGYPLQTEAITSPGLIEVYPHPALVELAGSSERLPYKVSKARTYWPLATPADRRLRLQAVWHDIAAMLERHIKGVIAILPKLEPSAGGNHLKAYEDTLDAIVCSWIATCAIEGRATPLGDKDSAIWISQFNTDQDHSGPVL